MEHERLPIACTLGPDDGRTRMLRWKRLQERGGPAAHLDGGHLQVRYRSDPGIQEELTSLAHAEQACCSFAEWIVSMDDEPTLHVTAAPEALAPIAAMFGVDTQAEGPDRTPPRRSLAGSTTKSTRPARLRGRG